VSTDRDRDPLDDRLLRRALRPNEPASAEACLDAESLAAWASGTLTADAAEDVDRHLATCARCQALLATFAATEDATVQNSDTRTSNVEVAPTVVPFRARPVARWIPLVVGTMAASLLIWMAWPRPVPADRADQTMAAATPPPVVAVPRPPVPSILEQARPGAQANAAAAESKSTIADARSANTGKGRAVAPSASANQRATLAPAAPPAPRPAPMPVPYPTAVTAGAGVSAPTFIPPPAAVGAGAAAATPTPARPEIVALRGSSTDAMAKTEAPSRVIAEFSSPATPPQAMAQPLVTGTAGAGGAGRAGGGGRGGGGGGGAAGGGGGARTGSLVANRAVSRVNWRVLASGQVERSVTGGDTWAPVTISPPAVILGGAAPSPSVCWLVGRTGIVLLSTDGITFSRVFFPDVSDLRSVIAIDEREATVTTTDGRAFKTDDGGRTWEQKDS
jgi:uncharacterized membrane protein YgcG